MMEGVQSCSMAQMHSRHPLPGPSAALPKNGSVKCIRKPKVTTAMNDSKALLSLESSNKSRAFAAALALAEKSARSRIGDGTKPPQLGRRRFLRRFKASEERRTQPLMPSQHTSLMIRTTVQKSCYQDCEPGPWNSRDRSFAGRLDEAFHEARQSEEDAASTGH